jgi:hypothetical protein
VTHPLSAVGVRHFWWSDNMIEVYRCKVCRAPFEFDRKRYGFKRLYCSPQCRKKSYEVKHPNQRTLRILNGLCTDCGQVRTTHASLCRKCQQRRAEYNWKAIGINDATEAQYLVLLKQQGGTCAICHQSPSGRRLAWDHDHQTGESRGLLCFSCNYGLGILENFHITQELWDSTMHYMKWG